MGEGQEAPPLSALGSFLRILPVTRASVVYPRASEPSVVRRVKRIPGLNGAH
jgi:hypothetical protein